MEKNINLLPLFVLLVLQIYQCEIDATAYAIVLEKMPPSKLLHGNYFCIGRDERTECDLRTTLMLYAPSHSNDGGIGRQCWRGKQPTLLKFSFQHYIAA